MYRRMLCLWLFCVCTCRIVGLIEVFLVDGFIIGFALHCQEEIGVRSIKLWFLLDMMARVDVC